MTIPTVYSRIGAKDTFYHCLILRNLGFVGLQISSALLLHDVTQLGGGGDTL